MNVIRVMFLLLAGLVLISCSGKRMKGEEVRYNADGTALKGYYVYDPAVSGKRPGVLVVHEWWGHNEYARRRADMLAGLGYAAFALDMYGEGKLASHPADAMKFAGEVTKNLEMAMARFKAALDVLKKRPEVDPARIAAIGYCFGGGIVLNMARKGVDLKGVASFHGSLAAIQPARRGEVKAKILVLNGADDPFTTAKQIDAFKKEMKDAGVNLVFVNYPGAKHAFTNPLADRYGMEFKLPLAYSADADMKSWEEMRRFLEKIFAE